MVARTKQGGIEVDGLEEAIKALGKLDKKYRAEAVDILRDGVKEVQGKAQKRIHASGSRMKPTRSMIGRSATAKGAGVKLRGQKLPWAFAAEFGEVVATVYGREVGQSRFKRRTTGGFKPPTSNDMGKNRGGYMIQPVIRILIPKIAKESGDRITELITRVNRQAGVKSRNG